MLIVNHLYKSFGGVLIVEDLSLRVDAGEVVALTGMNGAGKTTTLRCIVGAEDRDSGDISLDGQTLDERDPETRRRVCALLDDWAWFSDMTVREHLIMFAQAHGVEDKAVEAALLDLGLIQLADRLPGTLSSGQTRRFGLAQALVRPWDVLILDEPEQRLDGEGREWLGRYLRVCAEADRSVLMASHDPELQQASGARVIPVSVTGR
ncbi:ABC transporter ATP-binding protein [Flexivirga meconopsidis]|uniref:ABC transporter ATP-binding protein n=1 Tax=Flexivirga meconopsidis TaxID=2977121 RepID=UPI00223E9AE9|nr:ABC transporter ATP-binding protein [Flexivirga meconopsidis]